MPPCTRDPFASWTPSSPITRFFYQQALATPDGTVGSYLAWARAADSARKEQDEAGELLMLKHQAATAAELGLSRGNQVIAEVWAAKVQAIDIRLAELAVVPA